LNLNRLLSASFSSQKQLNNNTPDLCDNAPINLDNSALIDQDFDQDRFEWAVLYENQRGQVLSYLCNILSSQLVAQNHPFFRSLLFQPLTTPFRPFSFHSPEYFSQT
jgi:hypothetical protein